MRTNAAASATDIHVKRTVKDGWYVYTSDEVPGLYVASRDDREAYEDLPPAIQKLLELNRGVVCKIVPKLGYTEFMTRLSLRDRAVDAVRERTVEMLHGSARTYTFTAFSEGDGDATR